MSHKWTKFFILISAVVVLALGAFTAFAQDSDDTTPTFGFGPRWMHSEDWQPGFGMGWNTNRVGPMWSRLAEALGLTEEEFVIELRSGKTLSEIAEAQGIELGEITAVLFAEASEHLNAMVEAGIITQEQATARLTLMAQHLDDMPLLTGEYGPGPFAGRSFGMMGRGWNNNAPNSGMRWGWNG